MEEAYFVLFIDPKPHLGRNPVVNEAISFATEDEAWKYARNHPPKTADGRGIGVAVVKGMIAKSVATESGAPHQKDKWFVPKWAAAAWS